MPARASVVLTILLVVLAGCGNEAADSSPTPIEPRAGEPSGPSSNNGRSPLEAATKAFLTSESDRLVDEDWTATSTPWLKLDGHQVFRRTSGQLINLSARAVAGAMCPDCGGYAVIVGPGAQEPMDEGVRRE